MNEPKLNGANEIAGDESLRKLIAVIQAAEMGQSVEVLTISGQDVIKVELDSASNSKARTLLQWLDLITVWDMVAGKFRASDPVLRLNIRGQFPCGVPVIVVAPFHGRDEAEQTVLINASIERQQPAEMVDQLVAIETRARHAHVAG